MPHWAYPEEIAIKKKKKFYSAEMFAMFEFYFLLVKLNNQITEQKKSGVLETVRIQVYPVR